MTEAEVYADLSQIFQDVFMREVALSPALQADDVEGWDSVRHLGLILAIEQHFGIKFSSRDIEAMQTVGDLAHTVQRRAS